MVNLVKKEKNKYIKLFIIILNIIGSLCLLYFGIPFIKHDMTIKNPNAMLSSYSWDSCGFILTLGLIPLIVANVKAYIYVDLKNKKLKLLYFIPSLICLILVSCYLFISFTDDKETYKPELVGGIKCELNGKVHHYSVYKEQDGTYSLDMEDDDKIPQSVIDYESANKIFESIENYYKNNGGMCP